LADNQDFDRAFRNLLVCPVSGIIVPLTLKVIDNKEFDLNLKLASGAGLAIAALSLIILIFQESMLAVGFVGILVQFLSVMLMIWARLTFGQRSFHAIADPTEGGLITTGPYHFLRHPIYAALMYFFWSGIFSHLSLLNLLLGIVATVGLIIRIFAEERLVTERYPDYVNYAERTKRVISFIL
jgi:protein-S-isoprenylcysteine O-methyltransferase Ste14